jgi:RHS repeat-associated protein
VDWQEGTASYAYNGQGDRLQQTIGITTTNNTLDTSTSLSAGLAAGLTRVLDNGSFTYLYGNSRIAQYGATGAQDFLGDALGSARQLVDSSGKVLLSQSYEPYGDTLSKQGEGVSIYQFTGEVRDATGLTYLRARYPDSGTGRFIQVDPSKIEECKDQ